MSSVLREGVKINAVCECCLREVPLNDICWRRLLVVVDGTKDKLSVTGKVGFVKEAPVLNMRGFKLYCKSRLIVV